MDTRLEERYIVVKISDLHFPHTFRGFLKEYDIPTRDCVVVESDWPIYTEVVDKVMELANAPQSS